MPIPSLKTRKTYGHKEWRSRVLGRRERRRKFILRLSAVFILSLLVMLVGMLAWVSRDLPTPDGIVRRTIPQSTKIYDRTGENLLYSIHGDEKRTTVELKDIPPSLINATLTAEDREFYNHKGFRFTSMIRSLFVNLLHGGKVQGGSTITQQFIKNAIFTNEKLYTRKIKEIILAYQIERKFSKDEILKLYFNEIPYGSNAYGADAAAQTYFGKPVRELNLAESAVLAAMVKAPTYYSPWGSHQDELIGRQHYILDAMASLNYISQEEAEVAKQSKLNFLERKESITAPHFVFYIRELLAEKYGERTVEQGGLKIITTLDIEKQKLAEDAVLAQAEINAQKFNANNASLVALDVPTNQILAMVGSKDFFDEKIDGQVNVALRPRQPGSSFKPIVYGAALDLGFTPETVVFDVNTVFKTDSKDYEPKNYNLKEHGPVTMRTALAGSLNIPAVKFLYLTGLDRVLAVAKKFGYSTLSDRSRFGLSIVLGGAEIKMLEHTSAYATLAREGEFKPTVGILRIEDAQGNILEEYKDSPGTPTISQQAVRELTSILSDNSARSYIFGEQNYLTLPDRQVAAKTGTTNDYRDAWTLGYTPQLAVGVWVGNSNNEAMARGADGSVVAAPIWQKFMKQALSGVAPKNFNAPEPRTVNKPMLNGQIGGELIEIDKATGLRATDLTPSTFRVSKLYGQYHTILHYVTPGDPLGPSPLNPETDQQYSNWEQAVRRWAQEQGLYDEIPPDGYDYLHTVENKPQISFINPLNNQTITDNPVNFSVSVSAPRGVNRVTYFIDNQEIGTVRQSPWNINFPITQEWPNGFHQLTVVAYDDIDNSNQATINFNLLVKPLPNISGVNFNNISNGQQIKNTDLPYVINLSIDEPDNIKQIDLYLIPFNGPSDWLGVISSPQKSETITWPPVQPGAYTLSLVITNQQGQVISGPKVTINIVPN